MDPQITPGQRALSLSLAHARTAATERDWQALRLHARGALALHPDHAIASRLLQIAVARLQNPLLATPTTGPPAVAGPAASRDDPHTSPLEIFLRRVVDHDLRPLNDSASRLLAIEDQDGFSSHRLTGILEQDPVLAAKMLRLANSAFQPSLARVRNLRDAVIRLGLETVRSAALGACLRETLGEGKVLDERIFWRHSAAVAVLARLQAESRRDPGDEAFTAGLLHNIGLLALDQLAPQDLRRAIALAAQRGESLCVAEREVFGFTDAALGAAIADRWTLPPAVALAAAAGDNAGAGGRVLPGVAELVLHARTFARSRGLADGVGEGAAGELPAAWASAPLSSALIGFGGADGVLDRADGFLRATAA